MSLREGRVSADVAVSGNVRTRNFICVEIAALTSFARNDMQLKQKTPRPAWGRRHSLRGTTSIHFIFANIVEDKMLSVADRHRPAL